MAHALFCFCASATLIKRIKTLVICCFVSHQEKGHLIYYPKARTYINNVMQYISRNEQKRNMLVRLRWKVLSKAKVRRKDV